MRSTIAANWQPIYGSLPDLEFKVPTTWQDMSRIDSVRLGLAERVRFQGRFASAERPFFVSVSACAWTDRRVATAACGEAPSPSSRNRAGSDAQPFSSLARKASD